MNANWGRAAAACGLLIASSTAATVAGAQSVTDKAQQDQTIDMSTQEPAMRKAMQQARATLDEFLAKAAAPAEGTRNYAVKVGVRDGAHTEYFWVKSFVRNGDLFEGTINNEPRFVKTVKFGERYRFSRSQIVDWTYADPAERRMYGNFTACALLTKQPAAEADEFKRRYGLECP